MTGKHIPQRTCVCCRLKTDKRSLVRVSAGENGLSVGGKSVLSGRGAYVCSACASGDLKKLQKALARAFKRAVSEDETRSVVIAAQRDQRYER